MRTRTLRPLLAALALAPAFAHAQQAGQPEEQEQQEQQGAETEGADVGDEEQPRAARGGREAAPGQVHTVERGDTLWDLSQRYLGNAWYWPKVWSYNPEISNPHWIYPGNLVRFFAAGEEAPAEVGVGPAPLQGATELPMGEPEEGGLAPAAPLEVTGRISFVPAGGRRVVHDGFVTERELDESGVLEASFSEALMLSAPDTVYVRFRRSVPARVGDRAVVFRTEQVVKHPVSGKRVGYLTKLLGTLRVVKVDGRLTTARIEQTWGEITRGALVGPYDERLVENVQPRPNERELAGRVVSALVPYLTIMGEHNDLVLDVGSADGVQQGNTFLVVRQQDLGGNFMNPARGQDPDLPKEEVARCLAVDVKDRFTVCTLVRSLREVVPGDRVELRPESPANAGR